jgi:hypothetical protein
VRSQLGPPGTRSETTAYARPMTKPQGRWDGAAMTEQSPTAQDLFDKLAAKHLHQPGVGRRRMFGREGLNVNVRFFAFLNYDQVEAEPPAATAAALITAGEALSADTLKRTMRRWVSAPMPVSPADHHHRRQMMANAHANVGGNQNEPTGATVDVPELLMRPARPSLTTTTVGMRSIGDPGR